MKKMMPRESDYLVTEEAELLNFLLSEVRGKSRNNLKSLLARNFVRVDGRPVTRFDEPLHPGQCVTLMGMGAALPFPILYEDEELLVVDKPAGLLTIASDREKQKTAYRMAMDYLQSEHKRVFIVHRLDRDTSGVLLFAKNEDLKRAFQDRWAENILDREYLAVVEGGPKAGRGTIRSFLRETATHLVYSGAPGPHAKRAITHYRVLDQSRGRALVELHLGTGRKNQIRVHMKELGCPVAGDRKYGAVTDPLGRLCLHANRLVLRHPYTGKELTFTAPAPEKFARLFPKAPDLRI
ncbi:MAG: RluA family pseudouridine synthase [Intestinimonas sp.]|jgi:23S rRNA pseudouridine1911/1915/1917 synthase|nr:RluA family pseudouridine synthase [Intestinimonas sp.]